jgi:hypothetical protein
MKCPLGRLPPFYTHPGRFRRLGPSNPGRRQTESILRARNALAKTGSIGRVAPRDALRADRDFPSHADPTVTSLGNYPGDLYTRPVAADDQAFPSVVPAMSGRYAKGTGDAVLMTAISGQMLGRKSQ